jgi:DNA modification methylase
MIVFGDCRETMRQWAKDGIKAQTCVTSPPYYGLRDYGTGKWVGGDENCDHVESENKHGGQRADRNQEGYKKQYKDVCKKCNAVREDGQIGLEETPEEYIKAMVEVFRCVWDVLEDNGTLWLNIGDSYYNYRPGKGQALVKQSVSNTNQDLPETCARRGNKLDGLKEKDLIGIPWMLAFALRADGWYLRQDIIWHKPNPMPESVQDRCTKSHEYIFLLSKSKKYYFDNKSIREKGEMTAQDSAGSTQQDTRLTHGLGGGNSGINKAKQKLAEELQTLGYSTRNKRDVWTVAVKPYSGAHFATFPKDLIEPCIKAGCPEGGVVLDPFMGSGTTAYVAALNGRKYLGCELNPDYKPLQDERIRNAEMETAQMSLI